MFLDNHLYPLEASTYSYGEMGPGYVQFFRVFCLIILICVFPLIVTGTLNTARNLSGNHYKTLKELKKIEGDLEHLKLPKTYQQYYRDVKAAKNHKSIFPIADFSSQTKRLNSRLHRKASSQNDSNLNHS